MARASLQAPATQHLDTSAAGVEKKVEPALAAGSGTLQARAWSALTLAAFCLMAFAMATRRLFTAPDDVPYLDYFSSQHLHEESNWWLRVLAEPVWASYSSMAGEWLGAELAMRVTIGLSTLCFLYFSWRISRGAALLVLAGFVLDNQLGTQMYYNQLRQGIAVSVFLAVAWSLRRRERVGIWLSAAIAALIHSSFLIVLFAAVAALSVRHRARAIGVTIVASVIAMLLFRNFVGIHSAADVLGRRSGYALKTILNWKFYAIAVPQYFLTLYLAQPEADDLPGRRWYDVTIALVVASCVAGLVHAAGARLFYICDVFTLLVLGQNIARPRARLAATFFFVILTFIQLNEGSKTNFDKDSLYGRWVLILDG